MQKVLIAMPTIDWKIPVDTVETLVTVDTSWIEVWYWFTKRSIVFDARNRLVWDAVEYWYDYILFMDDDNPVLTWNNFLKLMLEDISLPWVDIVTGLYKSRTIKDILNVYEIWKDKKTDMYDYIPLKEVDWEWIKKVANCWCWCVLIKREVFETLYNKYYQTPFEYKRVEYLKRWEEYVEFNWKAIQYLERENSIYVKPLSEDLLFFERAVKEWFSIYADERIRCGHIWIPQMITV